jgi:regulator of nonsense transcripts 2
MLKTCCRGRYKSIQAIASVAAKLRRHKPEVCIRLIDAVLEELQWNMEHPSFKDQQRTITIARLLGELYCASLASGQLIIQQLYKFINFCHEIPEALRAASGKQAVISQAGENSAEAGGDEKLPVFDSAYGVSQTIQEDEEMDEAGLEAQEETPQEPQPVAVSRHSKYDPRVPTPLDPPNSVFRIKLACTLLGVVSKTIVTRNNLSKIEGFLDAFQRYLFTKTILPIEVEFALLDTFDMIDSQWRKVMKELGGKSKKSDGDSDKSQGFPRYLSWLEAHNLTVATEEAEVTFKDRAKTRLEALGGNKKSADEEETLANYIINDDDDLMEEDDDDSLEDPLSVSARDSLNDDHDSDQFLADEDGDEGLEEEQDESQSGGSNEEDESDKDASDEDSDDNEASEEESDEQAYMQQLEAEAFERELRRLTMDALERGKAISRGGKVADLMPTGSQVTGPRSSIAFCQISIEKGSSVGIGYLCLLPVSDET